MPAYKPGAETFTGILNGHCAPGTSVIARMAVGGIGIRVAVGGIVGRGVAVGGGMRVVGRKVALVGLAVGRLVAVGWSDGVKLGTGLGELEGVG